MTARRDRYRMRIVFVLAAAILAVAVLVRALSNSGLPPLPSPRVAAEPPAGDPFAYLPSRQASFVARAAAGNAHVLFEKSPGGAYATAARVARFRPLIAAAVAGTSVSAGTLEGRLVKVPWRLYFADSQPPAR